MRLHDRTYAAFLLEEKLRKFKNQNAIVLAISRSGVPLGYRISSLLHLPLEVIAASKIYHPVKKELAIGSVCGDEVVLAPAADNVSHDYLQAETERVKEQVMESQRSYMDQGFPIYLEGKTVLLVDDGAVTGNTLKACLNTIKKHCPARIVVAVPVFSAEAKKRLQAEADEFISLHTPYKLQFISQHYDYFPRITDSEVNKLLRRAAEANVAA